MEPDPVLRRADPGDAPVLLEIMSASLAAERSGGAIPHDFADRNREIAWLDYLIRGPEGHACVAEMGGRPAAFGITARRGGVNWLAFLFVAPEHQGRGLGRQVLARLWPAADEPRATLVDGSSRVAMAMYLGCGLSPCVPVLAFTGTPAPARGTASIHVMEEPSTPAAMIDDLDAAIFGGERRRDHEYWTSQGFSLRHLRRSTGEWIGYARWSPAGRLGPVALDDESAWPEVMPAIQGAMQADGLTSARMMIPAVNRRALLWACQQGYSYTGMEVALATQPVGDWGRCLIHRAALP